MNYLRIITLPVIATLFTACGGSDNDKEVKSLQNEVDSLVVQLNNADTDRAALTAQIQALTADIEAGKAIDISLLHMNDHHSHLEEEEIEIDVTNLELETDTETVITYYGGFPMITSAIKQIENQYSNLIKIHAGDAITGTLYYTLFNGEADAAMMNQICFDIFALGNHEFDSGDAGLAYFLDGLNSSACETSILAANVTPHAESAITNGYIQPYRIMAVDDEMLGLIGIDIADKTKNSSQPDEGTTFQDELTTAQTYIDELETLGVNKIILVTHYQYANDISLAENLSGVDVIVGGDSHTLLGDETFEQLGFNVGGDYPTRTSNADGELVCIVQAWEYAHLYGKLDVSFDSEGVVTSCEGSPILPISNDFYYEDGEDEVALPTSDKFLIRQSLTQHPEIVFVERDAGTLALLEQYKAETTVLVETVIGSVAEDLCLVRWPGDSRSNLCDVSATYEMGSDISNIVAKAFLEVTPTADIAIQNGGGVRVDVATGDYTIADAYTLLPFSNTLVTLQMDGQQIVNVLEDALSNTLDDAGSTGSYPYASGLRYNVDASAEFSSRISNVEINSRLSGDWTAIDLAATYTVVTNDFIASGRDGYDTFGEVYAEGEFVDTYTEYAQGFVNYVNALTAEGLQLQNLPASEYSTQNYIGRDGCDHGAQSDCADY